MCPLWSCSGDFCIQHHRQCQIWSMCSLYDASSIFRFLHPSITLHHCELGKLVVSVCLLWVSYFQSPGILLLWKALYDQCCICIVCWAPVAIQRATGCFEGGPVGKIVLGEQLSLVAHFCRDTVWYDIFDLSFQYQSFS